MQYEDVEKEIEGLIAAKTRYFSSQHTMHSQKFNRSQYVTQVTRLIHSIERKVYESEKSR